MTFHPEGSPHPTRMVYAPCFIWVGSEILVTKTEQTVFNRC
jgi:hypothetical protein